MLVHHLRADSFTGQAEGFRFDLDAVIVVAEDVDIDAGLGELLNVLDGFG